MTGQECVNAAHETARQAAAFEHEVRQAAAAGAPLAAWPWQLKQMAATAESVKDGLIAAARLARDEARGKPERHTGRAAAEHRRLGNAGRRDAALAEMTLGQSFRAVRSALRKTAIDENTGDWHGRHAGALSRAGRQLADALNGADVELDGLVLITGQQRQILACLALSCESVIYGLRVAYSQAPQKTARTCDKAVSPLERGTEALSRAATFTGSAHDWLSDCLYLERRARAVS